MNLRGAIRRNAPPVASMQNEFNHAENASPRSGSSKQVAPLVWCAVVIAIIAIAIWFAIKP